MQRDGLVVDNISPIAICKDTTIYLDVMGMITIGVDYINNGKTDNCGVLFTTIPSTTYPCEDDGVNTVTLRVTDVNENINTCSATGSVKDRVDIAPIITGEAAYYTSIQVVEYSLPEDINIDSYEWSYRGTGVTINSGTVQR